MDNDNKEIENTLTVEDIRNDTVLKHPNGTLWAVLGYPDLDYYNIYQFDEKKGIYQYNPFFLDDNPKVIIKKQNGEFKVGMTLNDLYKLLVHEHFKHKC